MSSLSPNHSNTNQSPPMKFKMPRLGNRNLKLAPNLSNQGPNDPPLLLERMHIPKKQINLQNPSEHVLFRL